MINNLIGGKEMKVNELMIGDYIQDLAGDLCQVIVLDRHVAQVETLTGVHQGDTTRYLHEAEGVPLTPEILEKNGFEEDIRTYAWGRPSTKARNYELCEELDECCLGYVFYISLRLYKGEWLLRIETNHRQSFNGIISYIHELQHALRLCGIEKEIAL